MQFNEKLKKLRAENGVSQSELAEKIYVSRSAVAKWENGLGLPSDESLALLAEYFSVEKSELLSDPETASVIINKNDTLSRQKLWIISLASLLLIFVVTAAILIPLTVKNMKLNTLYNQEIKRELIFETEKYFDTDQIINYPDYNLTADNYFYQTRVFTYNNSSNYVKLPKILIKSTCGDKVTYEEVDIKNVGFSYSPIVYASNYSGEVRVGLRNTSTGEGCINIFAEQLYISVKIVKKEAVVQSLYISTNGSFSMGALDVLHFDVDVYPEKAVNADYRIRILKIDMPDGTVMVDNFEEYAYISNSLLHTTAKILPKSVIYVDAVTTASAEKVWSNIIKINIVRTEATDIVIEGYSDYNTAKVGEVIHFKPTAYPENASFNLLNERAIVILTTPELATLEEVDDGYVLTVNADKNNIDKEIYVKVMIGGIKKTLIWHITG